MFFTLFSGMGSSRARAQVVNLDTGALVGHSEGLALGSAGSSRLDVMAVAATCFDTPRTDTWEFSVSGPGLAVSLSQRPEKPYALHGGGTGVIQQSVAGISHYYSATRMRASGTLRSRRQAVAVTGESWFDHQWGDYAFDPRAFNWDWFSCRFDDRTELMGYQFLDRSDRSAAAWTRERQPIVAPDGHGRRDRRLPGDPTTGPSTAAGHTWPLDWQLHVSSGRSSPRTVTALVRRPARPQRDPPHLLGGRQPGDRDRTGPLLRRALLPLAAG